MKMQEPPATGQREYTRELKRAKRVLLRQHAYMLKPERWQSPVKDDEILSPISPNLTSICSALQTSGTDRYLRRKILPFHFGAARNKLVKSPRFVHKNYNVGEDQSSLDPAVVCSSTSARLCSGEITHKIRGYSLLKDDVGTPFLSQPLYLAGHTWILVVYMSSNSSSKKRPSRPSSESKQFVGVYLHHTSAQPVRASYCLELVGSERTIRRHSTSLRRFSGDETDNENRPGWLNFCPHSEVQASRNGFLQNDTITFRAKINVVVVDHGLSVSIPLGSFSSECDECSVVAVAGDDDAHAMWSPTTPPASPQPAALLKNDVPKKKLNGGEDWRVSPESAGTPADARGTSVSVRSPELPLEVPSTPSTGSLPGPALDRELSCRKGGVKTGGLVGGVAAAARIAVCSKGMEEKHRTPQLARAKAAEEAEQQLPRAPLIYSPEAQLVEQARQQQLSEAYQFNPDTSISIQL
jgi:hypothetical protein